MIPYNEGYLAAHRANTYRMGGHYNNVPTCPHKADTQPYRTWFSGVVDCVGDNAAPKPMRLSMEPEVRSR